MRNNNGHSNGRKTIAFIEQQRRLVDFLNQDEDQECALLLALGYSDRFIMQRTGLRATQIHYRGKKAGVSRMEFRNGEGIFAKAVLNHAMDVAQPRLMSHLKRTGVLYAHAA